MPQQTTSGSPGGGFSTVLFEKRGAVAWVTLNRPHQLNAYNVAMRDDLFEVISAIHDDREIRAMVLTGAGEAFSSGGDLSEFGSAPSPIIARWARFRRDVWGRLRALPIPTLAAVHGFTVGGGLEMALLCDVAIAADNTRICLPETGVGMIPGVAGTQTAARRLGFGRAMDLCLTGRWIDAREALLIGLVAEVVPLGSLERRALELARALGRRPREQAALIKLAVWEGLELPMRDAFALERRLAKRYRIMSSLKKSARLRARSGRETVPSTVATSSRTQGGPRTVNTVNFVTIPASIVPEHEIVVFRDHRLTYAQLNEMVARYCAVFKQLGLAPKDVIATLDTNSERYIAAYYGAAKAGLTFLPLNYRAKDPELEYMINTAQAKVLLVGDRYLELVTRIRPRLNVNEVVALGTGDGNMHQLAELARRTDPDQHEAEIGEEDVSVLMYTSGTTSLPKGVMLRFRDFVAYVTANVEMADGTDRGVALVCVPFYHIAGTTAMMTNIWAGQKSRRHAAVRARRTWLNCRARTRHTRVRRSDHDEAVARRAFVQAYRFFAA